MNRPELRRVTYYPGCMSLDCAGELDQSLRAVLAGLDVEPVEQADWNCCGGDVVDSVFPSGGTALIRRIMDGVGADLEELICACPVCARRLRTSVGRVAVCSALEFLTRPHTLALIDQRRKEKLTGVKAACYYGPSRSGWEEDSPETPPMETLVRTCGLTPVKWAGRRRAHGGYSTFTRPALMRVLAGRILTDAIDAGADLIVLDDPHAQLNLDLFQYQIGRELKRAVDIPVLFASELVAHALGLDVIERCYRRHVTPPFRVFLDYYDRRFAVGPARESSGGGDST